MVGVTRREIQMYKEVEYHLAGRLPMVSLSEYLFNLVISSEFFSFNFLTFHYMHLIFSLVFDRSPK